MTRRMMQANTHPSDAFGFHGGEHYWSESCDHEPECLPAETQGSEKSKPDATSVAPAHDYAPPPKHYDGGNGLDPWQIIDAFGLDYYLGNALKYILRCGKKDIAPRLDDLIKARNYINKSIELEENGFDG